MTLSAVLLGRADVPEVLSAVELEWLGFGLFWADLDVHAPRGEPES